jgi:hypothetical protein
MHKWRTIGTPNRERERERERERKHLEGKTYQKGCRTCVLHCWGKFKTPVDGKVAQACAQKGQSYENGRASSRGLQASVVPVAAELEGS